MRIIILKSIIKQGLNLAKTHYGKILFALSGTLAIDNIRMRNKSRKDRKTQEKKDIETQVALRKGEARIHDLEAAVNASEYIQNVNNLVASNVALQQIVQQQDVTIKKMRASTDDEENGDERQK